MKTEREREKKSETSDETHDGVLELIASQCGHFVCAYDHMHVSTLLLVRVCVCVYAHMYEKGLIDL